MKYCVTARPGLLPPTPEQFDAAVDWLRARIDDGTFDCVYGFLEGGGFSVADVGSHDEVLDLMTQYPLYGMVEWDVRPVLDFGEGLEKIRAKLVEAQAAIGG